MHPRSFTRQVWTDKWTGQVSLSQSTKLRVRTRYVGVVARDVGDRGQRHPDVTVTMSVVLAQILWPGIVTVATAFSVNVQPTTVADPCLC